MSIDSNSQVVKSKYFAGKSAMDESLSDFQESKQRCKGPKPVKTAPKPKTRKVKHIKGQKDIRTALKGKKNELVAYTKEFDTVCKKSGLDVDSEQLQLAIALSKSLHTNGSDEATSSQTLTTQGRIAKIRTTLQEYGFKVPESKITTNKRKKKHRREYKLINTTEEERQQKISGKYAQILFDNLDCSKISENSTGQDNNAPIYNIATSLQYECMKDNSIFYVDNLVEKSATSGCLFKDWSKIPGRPTSPIHFHAIAMNVSEIVCSQDELDVILSGCIKSAKSVIASKEANKSIAEIYCDTENGNLNEENKLPDNVSTEKNDVSVHNYNIIDEDINLAKETAFDSQNKEVGIANKATENKNLESNSTVTFTEQCRSCSPDIFDDEDLCIMEISKPVILSQGQKTKDFTEETNAMELTECLPQNVEKSQLILSNITKRKSDDFMEITECAVSASQGIKENVKEIDLTQSPEEKSLMIGIRHNSSGKTKVHVAESPDCSITDNDEVVIAGHIGNEDMEHILQDNIDLTQKCDEEFSIFLGETNQTVPKNIKDKNKEIVLENQDMLQPKDDIDLTQSSNEDENELVTTHEKSNLKVKNNEFTDLTQSSQSSVDFDELPEVYVGSTQVSQSNFDDTIILNEEEYKDTNGRVKKSIIVQDIDVFDLTQADNNTEQANNDVKESSSKLCSQSFYDDFEYDHSDNKENTDDIEICENKNSSHNTSKERTDIDLTQSSEEHSSEKPVTAFEDIPDKSSLGKRDEVSIDYDELCEYGSDNENGKQSNNDTEKDSLNLKYDSSKSKCNNSENIDSNNDLVSNSSQISEVFDLTDKELDYSLHQSRLDIPADNYSINFGGISVMDDVSGVRPVKESLGQRISRNYTLGESFLPEVNVKKTEQRHNTTANTKIVEPSASSPSKVDTIKNSVPIVTPKNSEYIIKTDGVTPMLDYVSMTTPQRNRELDKYGLKPFKRKRAIKILTHLYNQTHPVVEPYSDDDQPSPSKKPKTDTNKQSDITPKKQVNGRTEEINTNMPSPLKEGITGNSKSPNKNNLRNRNVTPTKEGYSSKENVGNDYVVTSEVPNLKGIDCHPDDWVFQKREKAKVHSCRVPLHIAFYNYVCSRQVLKEAILRYEPVNIDVIHKDLVSYGHRYDPKDLLRFLDKRCITVKTVDNNARNRR